MVFISQAISNQLIKNITLEKGEMTNEKFSKLIGLIGVLAFTIAGCASGSAKDTKTETVKLGVVGTKMMNGNRSKTV